MMEKMNPKLPWNLAVLSPVALVLASVLVQTPAREGTFYKFKDVNAKHEILSRGYLALFKGNEFILKGVTGNPASTSLTPGSTVRMSGEWSQNGGVVELKVIEISTDGLDMIDSVELTSRPKLEEMKKNHQPIMNLIVETHLVDAKQTATMTMKQVMGEEPTPKDSKPSTWELETSPFEAAELSVSNDFANALPCGALKQIGTSMLIYAEDADDAFPPARDWETRIAPYLGRGATKQIREMRLAGLGPSYNLDIIAFANTDGSKPLVEGYRETDKVFKKMSQSKPLGDWYVLTTAISNPSNDTLLFERKTSKQSDSFSGLSLPNDGPRIGPTGIKNSYAVLYADAHVAVVPKAKINYR